MRKISHGEGVERVFQTHSPMIAGVKVKRRGDVRRAKLYYLRQRRGAERENSREAMRLKGLALAIAAIGLTGCGSLIQSATSGLTEQLGDAVLGHDDPELVREATPHAADPDRQPGRRGTPAPRSWGRPRSCTPPTALFSSTIPNAPTS